MSAFKDDALKKVLIFGISGQDGAYLASLLLQKGYEVHGTSRDAEMSSFTSLVALGIRGRVTLHSAVLTDFRSTLQVIARVSPDEIYNLAGQSSVGLSFQQPVETLESFATAALNVLEVLRFLGGAVFVSTMPGLPNVSVTTVGLLLAKVPRSIPRALMGWQRLQLSGKWLITVIVMASMPALGSCLTMNLSCVRHAF